MNVLQRIKFDSDNATSYMKVAIKAAFYEVAKSFNKSISLNNVASSVVQDVVQELSDELQVTPAKDFNDWTLPYKGNTIVLHLNRDTCVLEIYD